MVIQSDNALSPGFVYGRSHCVIIFPFFLQEVDITRGQLIEMNLELVRRRVNNSEEFFKLGICPTR